MVQKCTLFLVGLLLIATTGCTPALPGLPEGIVVSEDSTLSWEDTLVVLEKSEIEFLTQFHNRTIWITLKDGTRFKATQPEIDEAFHILKKSGKLNSISWSTE
ncbi:MAG: hypothetical protein JXA11_09575 [Phycisphaerae bacterium]|nr:hypothetical protein [Phycisphaerae bacterium]